MRGTYIVVLHAVFWILLANRAGIAGSHLVIVVLESEVVRVNAGTSPGKAARRRLSVGFRYCGQIRRNLIG